MGESICSTRLDVKLEESNTTSRPAENKKRANAMDDSTYMARSDFKLEEPSKLNFQGQVFDIEEPNSVGHIDKAFKDKPWKISTYTAHEESYDDKAAPCA